MDSYHLPLRILHGIINSIAGHLEEGEGVLDCITPDVSLEGKITSLGGAVG